MLALLFSFFFSTAHAAGDCRTTEVRVVRQDTPTTYWVCEGYVCGSLKTDQTLSRTDWNVVTMRTEAVVDMGKGEWISIWTECK